VGSLATFQWEQSSGGVDFYEVHVSRNGGEFLVEQIAPAGTTPGAAVAGAAGEVIRIRVAAGNIEGDRGPLSPESEPVRFVARPNVPDLLAPGVFVAPTSGSTPGDLFYDEPETGNVWLVKGDDADAEPEYVDNEPDPAWDVAAAGDFDGDGVADLFWHNATDGATRVWSMNGTLHQELDTGPDPGADWTPLAAGDFDGNAQDDVFWRSDGGQTLAWMFEGVEFGEKDFPLAPGEDWRLLATGDFDGDGQDELFWRDNQSATTALWFHEINTAGKSFVRFEYSAPLGDDWEVVEVAYHDGDDCEDLHMRLDLPHMGVSFSEWWWMNGAEASVGH
jgi:hypothetical protein